MVNFKFNFTIPWLLLLIIPALVLTLWPYFRLQRKYRRTRNRIISLVLHLCIMVMCISVLAGMTFSYDIANDDNEIILLVDASYSNSEMKANKDAFVEKVLDESQGLYKIGVVKFGYDQKYVAEMSNNIEVVKTNYRRSVEIDDSATDIEAALKYAAGLFTNIQNAKIILIADGIQTDGDALRAVRTITADTGIRIDTKSFPNPAHSEFEILGVQVPDYNIAVGETFSITVSIQSTVRTSATLTLTDLSELDDANKPVTVTRQLTLNEGVQNIIIDHSFEFPDLHELQLSITQDGGDGDDHIKQNNSYYSYIYLKVYNKILLLESITDEGKYMEQYLKSAKSSGGVTDYEVTRINIKEHPELVPKDVDELRTKYDEVILANISNADLEYSDSATGKAMPENFAGILNEYTRLYGGGVFAVGGSEQGQQDKAHAFNHEEYATYKEAGKTELADMLPVQVVEYTPPMGVMIVIDRSTSMLTTAGGTTKLEVAKSAALSCLDVLNYRDYIGVTTLEDGYSMNVSMMSALNVRQIRSTIDAIQGGGGTTFSKAIDAAGLALAAETRVQTKHMILITDGEPKDELDGADGYGQYIKRNLQNGITLTIIHISDLLEEYFDDLKTAANEYGHKPNEDGTYPTNGYIYLLSSNIGQLGEKMRQAISEARVTEVMYEEYTPTIRDHSSSVVRGINENALPTLGGFYGTREKTGSNIILAATYVPLYAEWQYGEGKVGAFMCSLNGTDAWSSSIMGPGNPTSAIGMKLLFNMVASLMPTKDISPQKIAAVVDTQNYSNIISINTDVDENEILQVEVKSASGNSDAKVVPVEITQNYKRATFAITNPGIYKVTVMKVFEVDTGAVDENSYSAMGGKCYKYNGKHYHEYLDETDGMRIKEKNYEMYKAFGYSQEYNAFLEEDGIEFMQQLASGGHGEQVDSANDVFLGTETVIHKVYDPRWLFMILSIVFFLLDIAVRKFKFKWPHEIVRDYKAKKKLKTK